MNATSMRAGGESLLFFCLFLSGYGLGRLGKPYGVILFNIHKWIGLGALIFLIVTAYQMNQIIPLGSAEISAFVVAILFFIASIVAGGLVSLETPMPGIFAILHKVLPYCAAIFSAITLYLVLK